MPHEEYQFGEPVTVIDEGDFCRVAETNIFDKFKIEDIEKKR